ncbi:hypothetical protein ACP4OV_020504 [Aristida adscensionis]
MALAAAAAARSRRFSGDIARRLHPVLPHLLASHCSGDTPTPPSPLRPPPPRPQSARFARTLFSFGALLAGAGPHRRSFSSSPSFRTLGDGGGAVLADAADAAAAAPASLPSEVAWIAEDSPLSVAAVQHLIDAVHSFTGLNWWKQFPANDEKSRREAVKRAKSLFKSITNMVEKLPCLKEGGAFWFTDLTTPDELYMFPIMTSLFLLLKLERNPHYLREAGSPEAEVAKMLMLLTVPLTASLPQAVGCYFVTWSFASLTLVIVLQQPVVKKLLHGELKKPTYSSSDDPKGPTAEGS